MTHYVFEDQGFSSAPGAEAFVSRHATLEEAEAALLELFRTAKWFDIPKGWHIADSGMTIVRRYWRKKSDGKIRLMVGPWEGKQEQVAERDQPA